MDAYKYYAIYQTTCKVNGKIYIGQHRTNDLNDAYLGSGTLIKEDIKRYGRDAFEKKILFTFDNFKEMNDKEKELVTPEFVAREDTYNRIIGGQLDDHEARKLGAMVTNKLKKQNGTANHYWIGDKSSQEQAEIITKIQKTKARHFAEGKWHGSFLGKHHTEETKQKIREFVQREHPHAGQKNPRYGKHWWHDPLTGESHPFHDDEVPQGWVRGRQLSEAALQNILESNKKHPHKPFMWVTNGTENKQLDRDSTIPNGWVRGKSHKVH